MTTTVTSKLEAINVMLTAIGESPVNTITSSTTTDVSIAIQILDNVSREVQSVGWHFNTDTNYKLTKNTSNQKSGRPKSRRDIKRDKFESDLEKFRKERDSLTNGQRMQRRIG